MANAPLQFPDDRNEVQAHLRVIRSQVSVVRILLDEVERLPRDMGTSQIIAEQLIDELTRLGCRTLETAAALAHGEAMPVPPASGDNVKPFARR